MSSNQWGLTYPTADESRKMREQMTKDQHYLALLTPETRKRLLEIKKKNAKTVH